MDPSRGGQRWRTGGASTAPKPQVGKDPVKHGSGPDGATWAKSRAARNERRDRPVRQPHAGSDRRARALALSGPVCGSLPAVLRFGRFTNRSERTLRGSGTVGAELRAHDNRRDGSPQRASAKGFRLEATPSIPPHGNNQEVINNDKKAARACRHARRRKPSSDWDRSGGHKHHAQDADGDAVLEGAAADGRRAAIAR